MIRAIFTLILLLSALHGFGQATLNALYGTPFDDMPAAVVQSADGGYVMAGNTSWNSSGWYDFNLVKTDSTGDTLWTRQYGSVNEDRLYDMKQTSDGGYILAGTTVNNGWQLDVYVVKTDSLGQLMWSAMVGHVGQELTQSVIETSDGNFLVCGTTDSLPVQNRHYAFLLKINTSGQAQWMHRYRLGGFSDWFGADVLESDSGGYVLTGSGTLNINATWSAMVIRTDTSGSVIWAQAITDSNYFVIEDILELDSGRIVVTGSLQGGPTGIGVCVLQLDADGNFLAMHTYTTALFQTEGLDVTESAHNELTICGKANNGSINVGLCMKVTLSGTCIYSHYFDQTHDHYFISCNTTVDGGTVLVGPYSNAHIAGDSASFFLAKTNLQGNAQCGTYNIAITSTAAAPSVQVGLPNVLQGFTQIPVVTYVKAGTTPLPLCSNDILADENEFDMQVYPNPVSETITVSLLSGRADRIVLMDVAGREIMSAGNVFGSTYEINFGNLPPGIYFISVTENGMQQTKKVVKE